MKAQIHTSGIIPEGVKNTTQYKATRNQRIFELRAMGESLNEIARNPEINLTVQRVQNILKDYKKYYREDQA